MFEVVERSMNTGGAWRTFSGFQTEEAAEEAAEELSQSTDEYWYEVRTEQ